MSNDGTAGGNRQYWLLKSEPSTYGWDDLIAEGTGTWDGVRNHQAKKNLTAMRKGDVALFYHSVVGKEVVGTCEIVEEAFPDPTDPTGTWRAVRVQARERFAKPVCLARIKAEPALADIALIKQSRLSVMPITPVEFERIVALAKG